MPRIRPDLARFTDSTDRWRTPTVSRRSFEGAVRRAAPEWTPEQVEQEILADLAEHGPSYSQDLLRARFLYNRGAGRNQAWVTILSWMIQQHGLRRFDKQPGHRDGSRNKVVFARPDQV